MSKSSVIAYLGTFTVPMLFEPKFFAAPIRNRNMRGSYYRACCSSFAWLALGGVTELAHIAPTHIAAYSSIQATADDVA